MSFQGPSVVADTICTCIYTGFGVFMAYMGAWGFSLIWLALCSFSFYSIYIEWKEGRF